MNEDFEYFYNLNVSIPKDEIQKGMIVIELFKDNINTYKCIDIADKYLVFKPFTNCKSDLYYVSKDNYYGQQYILVC